MAKAETFRTGSPAGTIALGKRLAGRLAVGDCVALIGELGAGKTVLVKGIAAGLGLPDSAGVTSPTFVLVHEYAGRVPIYHVDLYRLAGDEANLTDLGIDEMLADGVVLIEWAERAAGSLPRPRWVVEIAITAQRSRKFALKRVG